MSTVPDGRLAANFFETLSVLPLNVVFGPTAVNELSAATAIVNGSVSKAGTMCIGPSAIHSPSGAVHIDDPQYFALPVAWVGMWAPWGLASMPRARWGWTTNFVLPTAGV